MLCYDRVSGNDGVVMSRNLHVDYLGGRWDRPKKALRAQVQKSRRKGATVTIHSEVSSKKRASALRHRDYKLLQGKVGTPRAESAVSVKESEWKVLRWRTKIVGPDFGMRGPVVAVIALLENKHSGETLLVSSAHAPAGVEPFYRLRLTKRARAHATAVLKQKRLHRRWRRKHSPDAEVAFNDWNLNLKAKWVRKWIRKTWPGLRPVPVKKYPVGGTHGRRWIDWPIFRGLRKVKVSIHKRHAASDHRGVTLKARFRKRKGKR